MERKRIYLVGLGPGGREQMTQQAYAALADADVLCGYTGYVDLVRGWFPEKETYTTPMTQELARCRWALETAREGKSVAMLCSGDDSWFHDNADRCGRIAACRQRRSSAFPR